MLKTKDLIHRYPGSNDPLTFKDWQIEHGSQWLLSGPSGCGKSTLLHIISGLLKPAEGKVSFGETDLYSLSSTALDRFRGEQMGIIFQSIHLLNAFTVFENLQFPAFFTSKTFNEDEAMQLLKDLDLQHKANTNVSKLSRGEAQRAAIARALVHKPALLIADEPTASLDDENCRLVAKLLKEQAAQQQATLVVATHDSRLKSMFENIYQLTETHKSA
jgi:putative ABC transport system ATP-binding protein